MVNITKFEQQNKDLDTLRAMAAVAVQSGKYSADYNQATVLNIFMTARALGVDPMLALNGGFNIIKGKINMGAHFMVALARRAGHSLKVVEMTNTKCTIIGKRKDNEDSLKYEMDWNEATAAGLTNKDNWQKNPKQMLYCACVRNVFRILFADIAIPYDADEMGDDDRLEVQSSLETVSVCEAISESGETKESIVEHSRPIGEDPRVTLQLELAKDGTDCSRLDEWLEARSLSVGKPLSIVMHQCLTKFDNFKSAYKKWIES